MSGNVRLPKVGNNNEQLRSEIVEKILNYSADKGVDWWVFGGFVRDKVARNVFSDVDINFKDPETLNRFKQTVENLGYRIQAKTLKDLPIGLRNHTRREYQITYYDHYEGKEVSVTFDVFVGPVADLKLIPQDANVNSLRMGWNGEPECYRDYRLTRDILEDIKDKKYVSGPNISEDVRSKLFGKGFSDKYFKPEIVSTLKKNEEKMAEQTFFDMVKADGTKAAYRVAGTQMTKGTKAAIIALMSKQGQSNEAINAVRSMLDTEYGSAFISALLGLSLTYAPGIKDDPRAVKLAEEFRIEAIATAGNEALGFAVTHFLPVITNALNSLPLEESNIPNNAKVRVDGGLPMALGEVNEVAANQVQKKALKDKRRY